MSSRLHRVGTIFSRVDGLISKGAMKKEEIPLWFAVYNHFPPKFEPTYSRPAPKMEIKEIFYEDDVIRAKIHKKFQDKLGLINLSSSGETNSQKWIKAYKEYIAQGMEETEAIEKIANIIEKA